ncbi:B-cell receptor CD22-like [Pagrus major]|uniref:B-cell receptor CD22-like n=1 Tax=Pagrus major TaxID=143350 RepID=UPI003CC84936
MTIQVSVSDVGWYKCEFDDGTESADRELRVKVSNRNTLTLQPNWPQIFSGETITLRSNRPKAELRADDRDIPVGGSVILTCSVNPSAGWKYFWYRGEKTSEPLTTQLSAGRIRVSHGGVYWCRGGRGESVYYTEYSDPITVNTNDSCFVRPVQPESTNTDRVDYENDNYSALLHGDVCLYETVRGRQEAEHDSCFVRPVQPESANANREDYENDHYSALLHGDVCLYDTIRGRQEAEHVSNKATLTLQPNWPQIFSGETITLRCEIKYGGNTEWTYEWYKDNLKTTTTSNEYRIISATEAHSGEYRFKGRRDSYFSTEWSDVIKLTVSFHNKAVVTLQPNWSEIYRGETITLRCEIKDGGDTEWEYEWKTTSSEKPSNLNEHRICATASHSGDYWCKGRKKSEKSSTDWSDPFKLTVSDKPWPVLTVSPSWLSAGASVTLTCSVKDQSAGWRFYWYKTVPDQSNYFYSYELLPGNSSETEQDSYIVHGQTHTAGYMCRAGRGDPVYYTDYSEPKFVWSADFHSSASLTVSPDRAQHFTSDSVSLSCEGNSTEWRVRRLSTEDSYLSDCTTWRTMTGSTCKLRIYRPSDAVYWCESGSGEFSNAVNITIQDEDMILLSPARPVTEGDSVSLSCKLRRQTFDFTVFFYHNEKLIQNDTRWELNISAVSKSDEGFYKCQHSGRESAQSWMSVQGDSSFPVLLVVGLVCGLVLVIPLLVLFCYKASKDSCFVRPVQSESANANRVDYENDHYSALLHDSVFVRPVQPESANANHVNYENDHYSALLHGDVCLYDTIRGCQEAEHGQ